MKNIIYIDSTTNCECTCVSSVDDKSARLLIHIKCDPTTNPFLEIAGGRLIELTEAENLIAFTDEEIKGNGVLQFRFVNDERTGDYFNIKQSAELNATLYIRKTDNFNYTLNYKIISEGDYYTKAEVDTLIENNPGPKGDKGDPGESGEPGRGISTITNYYLATPLLEGVTIETSGWSVNLKQLTATNKYLWNYEKITYTDDSILITQPIIIGVYGDKGDTGASGADGRGISSITEYYLVSNLASGITTETSGWENTPVATTTNKKYLWNYEKITYTDDTSVNTVPKIIGTHGATGETGSKGEMGVGLKSIVEQYYLSSSNTSQIDGSWSTTSPTWKSGHYIWTRSYITWTDNTTSTTEPILSNVLNDLNSNKVDVGTVTEQLNKETAQLVINNNRLVVISDNFTVDKDGNVSLTGTIKSNSAEITGGSINIETDDATYSVMKLSYGNENGSMSSELAPNRLHIQTQSTRYNTSSTYSGNGVVSSNKVSDTERITSGYSYNNYGMYKETQTDAGPVATYYHRLNQNEAYHGVPLTAKSVKTAAGADLDTINSNLANIINPPNPYNASILQELTNATQTTIKATKDGYYCVWSQNYESEAHRVIAIAIFNNFFYSNYASASAWDRATTEWIYLKKGRAFTAYGTGQNISVWYTTPL